MYRRVEGSTELLILLNMSDYNLLLHENFTDYELLIGNYGKTPDDIMEAWEAKLYLKK